LTKSRKAIIAVILTLIVALVVTMSTGNQEEEAQEAQELIDLVKFRYAQSLGFAFGIVAHGRTIESHRVVFLQMLDHRPAPFYTDLVFVHSRAEAEGFPDNVLVAWPTAGGGRATARSLQRAVDRPEEAGLDTWGQRRPAVTLEQFGLSQPLTVEDLVDNWEKVNALFRALTFSERYSILRTTRMNIDLEAEGIIIMDFHD